MRLVSLLMMISLSVSAQMEVFIDGSHRVSCDDSVKAYQLQDMQQIENTFNNKTSQNFYANSAQMQEAFINTVSSLSIALNKASEYGIEYLPAITFDSGKYVVYGVTSCKQAIQYFNGRNK